MPTRARDHFYVSRLDARELGLPRYFTGKPCPHGHVCERITNNAVCVECDVVFRDGEKARRRQRREIADDFDRSFPPVGQVMDRREAMALGLDLYYTGRRCKHGHLSLRRIAGSCLTCDAASGASTKVKMLNAARAARRRAEERERIPRATRRPRSKDPQIILKSEAVARGLHRYFTGKPCKRGHVCERNTKTATCLACSVRHSIDHFRNRPTWVDPEALDRVYKNCPTGREVDHIVPVKGKTPEGYDVSGLHVPWNLRYLTRNRNASRGNRMVPEDFCVMSAG